MIASCPKCGARYRVEKERLQPTGARLRCSRCEVVFRVRPPQAVEAPAAAAAPAAAPVASEPPPMPGGPVVLVALPEGDQAKETHAALSRWGFQVKTVHDGVEALLEAQRSAPRVVVLWKDLPRMSGPEILQSLRRSEGVGETQVVLVGTLDSAEREALGDLPGPDGCLEGADLPDGLPAIFEDFGLPLYRPPRSDLRRLEAEREAAKAKAAAQPAEPTPMPAPAPQVEAPVPPVMDDGLGPQRAEAERLARIIVSDIVLYNEEKFARALQAEDVAQVMGDEIKEGRKLFGDRIDERVRDERDFLVDELRRVAQSRAGG